MILLFICTITFIGCHPNSLVLEPDITYIPQAKHLERLPSPFAPLSIEELKQEWGKEYLIGRSFANELDLYRAITSFKRALIIIPKKYKRREQELRYLLAYSYYIGGKYQEVVDIFETSSLYDIDMDFPALRDLTLILQTAYEKTGQYDKAEVILNLLQQREPILYSNLKLHQAFLAGDLMGISTLSSNREDREAFTDFLIDYSRSAKSVRTAQTLNAILPGAGYWYVGQTRSAVTSFFLNSLFIWATYRFFDMGNPAAGLITASFEVGWYFGGINGAGLAAKERNERLYECLAKEVMIKKQLFPVLMFETSF